MLCPVAAWLEQLATWWLYQAVPELDLIQAAYHHLGIG